MEDVADWRLKTNADIPYKLVDGGQSGGFGPEDAEVNEEYIIRSSDLLAFARESFPPMLIWDGTLFFEARRRCPGLNELWTQNVNWTPLDESRPCDPFNVDPDADAGTYGEFVKVTVNYRTGKSDPDPNEPETFLEVSAVAAADFLVLPIERGTATWRIGGPPVTEVSVPASILVPETQWTVRWPQIPAAFMATLLPHIRARLGTVNNVPMPLLRNPPIESVLFVGYSFREQYTWRSGLVGTPPVELEMKFLEKHGKDGAGHNEFYRPSTGTFELLIIDGHKVYNNSDLNAIFPGV